MTAKAIWPHVPRFFAHSDGVAIGQARLIVSWLIESTRSRDSCPDLRKRVDALIVEWIRFPQALNSDHWLSELLEAEEVDRRILFRLAVMICEGAIDLRKDHDAVERTIAWFNSWPRDMKAGFGQIIPGLQKHRPAPELWNQFDL